MLFENCCSCGSSSSLKIFSPVPTLFVEANVLRTLFRSEDLKKLRVHDKDLISTGGMKLVSRGENP